MSAVTGSGWYIIIIKMIKPPEIKPQILLAATLVSVSICAFALRANNQQMLELRQAVYTADERGEGVQEALNELQSYVTAHMNTSLSSGNNNVYPPIQLKASYDRLVVARSEKLAADNSKIYNDAQQECERQNPNDFSGRNRVPCIQEYVKGKGVVLPPISDALYKFSFVSPTWSPDLAGWSLLTSIVLAILTAVALARRLLRR